MHLSVLLCFSVFMFLISSSRALEYSNRWTVQIDGDSEEAERLAQKHGFVNHGKVIDNYFSFQNDKVERISNASSAHLHKGLVSEPNVKMVEQQVMKSFKLLSSKSLNFHVNDTRWDEMWYINRVNGPTYNVINVWKRNITGAGVVVAVVDEGFDPGHPEIQPNYLHNASWDVVDNDTNPLSSNNDPQYGHGEKCAGVIAAVANNSNCGVGLAFNAKLGGIRLFFMEKASDADNARALSHATDLIDIYSNSWGPDDKGFEVEGPGHLTQLVLRHGAEKGRRGLGSIYVFAAGNGGILVKDSCAFNGYVNNIYTIAITGVKSDGSIPSVGEHCAGIMAVTYTKDIFGDSSKVITADTNGACTGDFGASSAATAMASGLIALMLSANQDLSWRDVQHIVVRTARPDLVRIGYSDWNRNEAGLLANDYVGFGLMDATKMVDAAVNWTRVPPKVNCTIPRYGFNRTIEAKKGLEVPINLSNWSVYCGEKINFLEHVEVSVNLTYTIRGELLIKLISPQGTVSNLTHYRKADASFGAKDLNWVLMTLHHWGENATGPWKLILESSHPNHHYRGILFDWMLILHGTTLNPLENNTHVPTSVNLQPAPCPDPGDPYQGNTIGQDFRHDRTVRFTCPRDYIMQGVSAIKCTDGRWSNDKPSCKAPCDEPARPAHGGRWGEVFKDGHSVWFYCFQGYKRIGAVFSSCNDGTWDNKVPVCKGICRTPRTPSNVQLHGNSFLDGDEVEFSCDKNHDLFGNAKLRCVDRAWDSVVPECKARCTFLGSPEHGYSDHKSSMARGDKIKHGVQITYSCLDGYTLVGDNMQECNDGRWTKNTPLCKARCDEPATPAHGIRWGRDFKHGRSVTFYCSHGYQRIGAFSITCNNGTWDNKVPVCKGVCNRLRTPSNGQLHGNSILDGDEVTFSCDKNHDLFGNEKLRCVDRAWDSAVPECKARCTFWGSPEHGYSDHKDSMARGGKIKHGVQITYSCLHGYTLVGDNMQECNDGRWTKKTPLCKVVGWSDWNAWGGCSVTCGGGSQTRSRTCTNPSPSIDRPYCEGSFSSQSRLCNTINCPTPCDEPATPAHGMRQGRDFKHGRSVRFYCSEGYQRIGAFSITCNNGTWDNKVPVCKALARCNDPGVPDNGTKVGDDYRNGRNVTFRCNPPFALVGRQVIVCKNGKWSDSTPTCSNCGRSLENIRPDGRSFWCQTSTQKYLQIDLGTSRYKLTAVATQGGKDPDKLMKRYKISFVAGATFVNYSEFGLQKTIEGNKDAFSVVTYHFKEPFVTKTVRIHPYDTSSVCVRTEIYGCDPTPDCILVGSLVWGLWTKRDNSNNYYKAYITRIEDNHIEFVLEWRKDLMRRYNRNNSVLIIDKIPEKVSHNEPVIAVHNPKHSEWYRTGVVNSTGFANNGKFVAFVEFDNGDKRWVELNELRSVKRPQVCMDNI